MELVYRRHCDIAIVPLFCFPLRSKNKNTANKSENVHCYAMRCVKRYHIKHRIARSELANRWEKRINLLYRECVAALFMFNAFIHFESFCLLTCKTVASCICIIYQMSINHKHEHLMRLFFFTALFFIRHWQLHRKCASVSARLPNGCTVNPSCQVDFLMQFSFRSHWYRMPCII